MIAPLTTAQRQARYRENQRLQGLVRLTAYLTEVQREKYHRLGGEAWLRKMLERVTEVESVLHGLEGR